MVVSVRNSSQLRCSPFGSANRCISDFANAPSKSSAIPKTSDTPRKLYEMLATVINNFGGKQWMKNITHT